MFGVFVKGSADLKFRGNARGFKKKRRKSNPLPKCARGFETTPRKCEPSAENAQYLEPFVRQKKVPLQAARENVQNHEPLAKMRQMVRSRKRAKFLTLCDVVPCDERYEISGLTGLPGPDGWKISCRFSTALLLVTFACISLNN